MPELRFVGPEELAGVASLASSIWHEYFPIILSDDQIDYMVDRFQSLPAMTEQVTEKGYRYAFIEDDGHVIGYTGVCPRGDRLFLSKLYLRKEHRGRGLGSASLQAVFSYARDNGFRSVCLTVNKYNEKAISAYRRNGMEVIHSICTDIGDGFVMDDYVMEKVL